MTTIRSSSSARDAVGCIHASDLQHVGDHVAMREHGALGDAGRAAGVLQERDVVAARSSTGVKLHLRPAARAH